MKANKRYTEASTSSDNLKDTTVCSISNRPHNSQSYRQPFRNFYKNPKTDNFTAPGNSRFQGRDYTYSRTRGYICYFHRKFRQMAIKCEGLQCKFYMPVRYPYRFGRGCCCGPAWFYHKSFMWFKLFRQKILF